MKHLFRKLALRLRAGLRVRHSRFAAARNRRIRVEPLEDRSLLAQLVNSGDAGNAIYNLPATASMVFLEDDGNPSNGISQIRIANGTFDTTSFSNPFLAVTINRGNSADTITINSIPSINSLLLIGTAAAPFSTITFAEAVTIPATRYISAFGGTITTNASLTTQGSIILLHATGDITLNGPLISGGGPVSLTADSDGDGSGTLILPPRAGDVIAAGNVSVLAADVDIRGVISSSGQVSIATSQNGRQINLGTNTAGSLGLSITEIDLLAAGILQIGNATGGNITVSTAVDLTSKAVPIPRLQLFTGAAIVDGNLANPDLTVTDLDVRAAFGIGTANNPLEVDTNILTTDSGSGSQFIVAADELTVGVNGLNARSGQIQVSAGTITAVGPVVTAGGTISLTTNGGITLNNALTSGGGEVQINADGDSDGTGKLVLAFATLDNWMQRTKLTANDGKEPNAFGFSVAISEDGSTAVIGAPDEKIDGNNNEGAAYIFTRTGNTWAQQQKLTASDDARSFGFSVALSRDGTTVLVADTRHTVGANSSQGAAYIFTRVGSSWIQQQQITATDGKAQQLFGQSVSLSLDGNTAILGTFTTGSAYVFTRSGDIWTQEQELVSPGASGSLGVSLSGDGETVFVGVPTENVGGNIAQGSVYVFTRVADVWTIQQKLVGSSGQTVDFFGRFIDISADGNTAVISAAHDDSGGRPPGSAYVFIRNGDTWIQQMRLVPSDSQAEDKFGTGVSINGDGSVVIVGANRHDFDGGAGQGAAYLFKRSDEAWTELTQLREIPGRSGNGFGLAAISGDGDTVIVGHSYDYPSPSPAYIFRRSVGGSIDAGTGNVSIRAADVDLQGMVTSTNLVYLVTDENPVTHGPAREQRIFGWATQMSAGPGNESGQQLSFEVITDKPELFATGGQPVVGVDGTLTFTPKPNARGIANVTVVLHDDGGGTNSSEPVRFQIEITKPRRWHNSAEAGPRNGLDVTGSETSQPDGVVAANDALAVINFINAKGSGAVGEDDSYGPPYCDVTGDDQVAADDVLKVINYINAGNESEGESGGENVAVSQQEGTDAAALDWMLFAADEYFRELGGKRRV